MEKCGNFLKNGRFSGRIWPDWGNTTRAEMAGLGSIGLIGSWELTFTLKYSSCLNISRIYNNTHSKIRPRSIVSRSSHTGTIPEPKTHSSITILAYSLRQVHTMASQVGKGLHAGFIYLKACFFVVENLGFL